MMRRRIRPGLLDLLTDHRPHVQTEAETAATFTLVQLRAAILRDLSWLLNTNQLALTLDLQEYPAIKASTLNYGLRSLTGREDNAKDAAVLRREILVCLHRFEPRLLSETLEVTAIRDPRNDSYYFRIEAYLWAEPQPLHMLMRTEVGESVGSVRVIELRGNSV